MCYREHAFTCSVNGLHSNKIMSVSEISAVLLSTEISPLWSKAVHGEAAAESLLQADIRHVSSHKQDPCKQK